MKLKKIIKSTFEGNATDTITLTITSSKRLHLFKRTLASFTKHCLDKILVSKVILFDDSSTDDDRFEMEKILEQYFPSTNIDFVYFNDIPTKFRHAYIMQHWFTTLESNFVFHLEDDWLFLESFSLKQSIDILKNDWEIISVGFSQSLRQFPDEYLTLYKAERIRIQKSPEILYKKVDGYWVWPYLPQNCIGEMMFDDVVRGHEGSDDLGINYWEKFLNYPPFGLQPAVTDVTKLKLIGNFHVTFDNSDEPIQLEGNYGKRVYPIFDSICTVKRKVKHIGSIFMNEKSAYDLNESKR
jgi:hypothetical protein